MKRTFTTLHTVSLRYSTVLPRLLIFVITVFTSLIDCMMWALHYIPQAWRLCVPADIEVFVRGEP